MEKIGFIEIRIQGSKGNLDLTPDTYDIRELIAILENAENLLFPTNKKDRPTISYDIEQGSVRHFFKTTIQFIIGFNAIIGEVNHLQSIDFLDLTTAQAFENIQSIAAQKNYSFTISTSIKKTNEIRLDRTTKFYRSESIWVDAEFYFYGKVTNAGGKERANIHIVTEELGSVRIETPITFLEQYDENLLYKPFGIRASGKQHAETGEIDKSTLKFINMIDYYPKYDETYLKSLRNKAKKSWLSKIDPNSWLRDIREGYDA